MIGVAARTVTLPAIEVPWWNTVAGEWQVARLAERSITILPTGEAPAPLPEPEPVAEADQATQPEDPVFPAKFWRRASELLAGLWLATLLAWWWTSRPVRHEPREPAPVPIHKRQSRLLRDARKAARGGEINSVKQLLLEWAALEWPDAPPRSIGAMSHRVSDDLASQLDALSSLSYGPQPGDFDGAALAAAIRSFSVLKEDDSGNEEALPPLMPGG